MRHLTVLLALFLASTATAQMLQGVSLQPDHVQLRPGETVTIRANGKVGCCSKFPWSVAFRTTNPDVATASGLLLSPAMATDVTIVALAPGTTSVVTPAVGNGTHALATIDVVCGAPPFLVAETRHLRTEPGRAVTLRVLPPYGQLSWYAGRIGDMSRPLAGNGAEVAFTPTVSGTHFAWTMSVEPCGTATAEFTIDALPGHRRAARR